MVRLILFHGDWEFRDRRTMRRVTLLFWVALIIIWFTVILLKSKHRGFSPYKISAIEQLKSKPGKVHKTSFEYKTLNSFLNWTLKEKKWSLLEPFWLDWFLSLSMLVVVVDEAHVDQQDETEVELHQELRLRQLQRQQPLQQQLLRLRQDHHLHANLKLSRWWSTTQT